jgi:hypothetical protein
VCIKITVVWDMTMCTFVLEDPATYLFSLQLLQRNLNGCKFKQAKYNSNEVRLQSTCCTGGLMTNLDLISRMLFTLSASYLCFRLVVVRSVCIDP